MSLHDHQNRFYAMHPNNMTDDQLASELAALGENIAAMPSPYSYENSLRDSDDLQREIDLMEARYDQLADEWRGRQ